MNQAAITTSTTSTTTTSVTANPSTATCSFEKDIDYFGNDLFAYPVYLTSSDLCCLTCQTNSNCQIWTYIPASSACWLKRQVGSLRVSSPGSNDLHHTFIFLRGKNVISNINFNIWKEILVWNKRRELLQLHLLLVRLLQQSVPLAWSKPTLIILATIWWALEIWHQRVIAVIIVVVQLDAPDGHILFRIVTVSWRRRCL